MTYIRTYACVLRAAAVSAGMLLLSWQMAFSAEPAIESASILDAVEIDLPDPSPEMHIFYQDYGYYELSVSANGSNENEHRLRVRKPADDAVVVKAYLLGATNYGAKLQDHEGNSKILLNGTPVDWMETALNYYGMGYELTSYLGDVTSIVKKKLDKRPKGICRFPVFQLTGTPDAPKHIDGQILVVVFENASLPARRSVALFFGTQKQDGDRFGLELKRRIDRDDPDSVANMGVGISNSSQASDPAHRERTVIKVNGKRLTSAAGGQDDSKVGATLTVGGLGDRFKNPPAPFAKPKNPRSDDELYRLKRFLKGRTRKIDVETQSALHNANLFFAWFELSSRIVDDPPAE